MRIFPKQAWITHRSTELIPVEDDVQYDGCSCSERLSDEVAEMKQSPRSDVAMLFVLTRVRRGRLTSVH